MKKTVQYFTKEYLARCKGMSSDQILEFLENYRDLFLPSNEKCQQASLEGIPYQTQIKKLMKEWLDI
jgi:hypothetical protein